MSLWAEIEDAMRDLAKVNAVARKFGRDMGVEDAAYYSGKSEAAFDLKEQGYPVTFIEMVVKGRGQVGRGVTG